MEDSEYRRLVQTATTNFIYKDGKFLFIKRADNKRVDPGMLNGIGGRVEPGEDYLKCAIREIHEEAGYIVTSDKTKLCGIVKLEGGYPEDWVICFFKVEVDSFEIPNGPTSEDGQLIWIDQDSVLDTEYTLVDDIRFVFKDIIQNDRIFFMTATLNDNQKIVNTSISYLDK